MYVMVILLVANQTQYFALPNPEVPTISDPEKVDFGDKTNNFIIAERLRCFHPNIARIANAVQCHN